MNLKYYILKELRDLRNHIHNRLYVSKKDQKEIVNAFHKLYYDSATFGGSWANTYWMGIPTMKCPLDMWVYQEMIFKMRPDLIVETGTAHGGSALFLSQMCEIVGNGKVVTVDITKHKNLPTHKRLTYINGSSTDPKIIEKIKNMAKGKKKILVILDSDHSGTHVFNELNAYREIVSVGSYIVVEDTNTNDNPVKSNIEAGGAIAGVRKFMKDNKSFVVDKGMEKFFLTFNPSGYLKRVK